MLLMLQLFDHIHSLCSNCFIGYNFNSPDQILKIQDIKESICYTAREYDLEMKDALDRNRISAVLPDGTPINLERERIQVAEMLFRPNLSKTFVSTCEDLSNFNPSQFGLQHTIAKAIGKTICTIALIFNQCVLCMKF